MSCRIFFGAFAVLFLVMTSAACSGSGASSGAGEGRFDVASLSDDVFRLCETTECGDYSEGECKFFLRYDILDYAYVSEDPDACFAALHAEIACLADEGSCDEESCYAPDDACTFLSEVPDLDVPEDVQRAQIACEFRADCEASFSGGQSDREAAIASCQIEYIIRTELFRHDRGSRCADAFIDFLVCIGESEDVPCSPSAEDEEAACPGEVARFEELCYDDE